MAALSSPNGHFIKASPVWPLCQEQPNCNFINRMASLSRTARRPLRPGSPSGYFIKANGRLIKANCRFIKANGNFIKAGFSKPATAIYQGQPQWQLYDGCSGKGQPLGLALGGPSRYCADLIKAGPDGQFIKASSNRKGQPLDLVLGGLTRYCAA